MLNEKYLVNCTGMAIVNHINEQHNMSVAVRQLSNDLNFNYAEARIMELLAPYKRVVEAAKKAVANPVWAGMCDEDIELENALREEGFIK